jgi:hypothetical protein
MHLFLKYSAVMETDVEKRIGKTMRGTIGKRKTGG